MKLRLESEGALKDATGTANAKLQSRLVEQVRDTLWFHAEHTPEERDDRLQAAFALLEGIKPTNEIEGMLATQMVGTHSAAMECLRRAMVPGQTFEGRDANLKHAAKLLAIYARQIEALDKHRGKGQQKVTVEHVHVQSGGQAIVGNVEAGQSAATAPADKPQAALTHAPGQTLDLGRPVPEPVKQRHKEP